MVCIHPKDINWDGDRHKVLWSQWRKGFTKNVGTTGLFIRSGTWVWLTLISIFHNVTCLLCPFCQFSTYPTKIGQAVEQPNRSQPNPVFDRMNNPVCNYRYLLNVHSTWMKDEGTEVLKGKPARTHSTRKIRNTIMRTYRRCTRSTSRAWGRRR